MTTEKRLNRKWLGLMSLALAAGVFALSAAADEHVTSPYATGGTVTCIDSGNFRTTYIHVFTNTDEVATFASTGKRDLRIRYLVVGAGGAGGHHYSNSTYGGGGGGGGGVCEKDGILFAADASWQVRVGKGAADYTETAGVSSISNGVEDVETVPGGGNGASAIRPTVQYGICDATSGAAGGGGMRDISGHQETCNTGAAGTYHSATLMDNPEVGCFKGGDVGSSRSGGSGGGAGAAATKTTKTTDPSTAGEGIRSDITGETLVYGSGGGGGSGRNGVNYFRGNVGGTRAGSGGLMDIVDNGDGTATTNYVAATSAEANSGGGGGGGSAWGSTDADHAQTGGADGIVVIRYDVVESPCAGGDIVTKTLKKRTIYTYIHIFTNVESAAEFVNISGRNLTMRYLVVGAGGAGGYYYSNSTYGGGGGGGGGVCEKSGVLFAADASWSITVGKGASDYNETAGASAISNGVADVETVPGGGNGASAIRPATTGGLAQATSGAAGGGGMRSDGYNTGADGTYRSVTLLDKPETGKFKGGDDSNSRAGGAGGGAGAAATDAMSSQVPGTAGEGIRSDITGETLVYGSGGGGGSGYNAGSATTPYFKGSAGGTRAGNGGVRNDDGTTVTPASDPAPNSGCGGGGASGFGSTDKDHVDHRQTGGADGIVVIRYDYNEGAGGLKVIFR